MGRILASPKDAVLHLVAQLSPTLFDPMDCSLLGSSVHGDSPGKNTGMGFHALLQGIFPTQGLNPGLPHCRWILYHLSHQGSPGILEWLAYPFSRGSFRPRNRTRISCRQILYQLSCQGSPLPQRWPPSNSWNLSHMLSRRAQSNPVSPSRQRTLSC